MSVAPCAIALAAIMSSCGSMLCPTFSRCARIVAAMAPAGPSVEGNQSDRREKPSDRQQPWLGSLRGQVCQSVVHLINHDRRHEDLRRRKGMQVAHDLGTAAHVVADRVRVECEHEKSIRGTSSPYAPFIKA